MIFHPIISTCNCQWCSEPNTPKIFRAQIFLVWQSGVISYHLRWLCRHMIGPPSHIPPVYSHLICEPLVKSSFTRKKRKVRVVKFLFFYLTMYISYTSHLATVSRWVGKSIKIYRPERHWNTRLGFWHGGILVESLSYHMLTRPSKMAADHSGLPYLVYSIFIFYIFPTRLDNFLQFLNLQSS